MNIGAHIVVVSSALASIAMVPMASASTADAPKDQCLQVGNDLLLKQGCAALDDFMKTFNSGDGKAWAATLNFPHVRLAGNQVQVWNTPVEYAGSNDVAELKKAKGWAYTKWTTRILVQRSDEKMHFTTQFTRYNAQDKPIGTYDSLYIVTKQNDHWGTQFRSSYVGIVGKKTAF
jgi:hypothetical protein